MIPNIFWIDPGAMPLGLMLQAFSLKILGEILWGIFLRGY